MKFLLISLITTYALTVNASTNSTRVVYGEDNRKDLFEVTNPLYLKLAKSTAAMVKKEYLRDNGDSYSSRIGANLEDGLGVCPSERFADQPLLSNCSGFLVGKDTIITAGHCYNGDYERLCEESVWVFDYKMADHKSINLTSIQKSNVYKCKSVVKQVLNGNEDFAVIKLQKEVSGREPLKYRKTGKISNDAKLVVIGHPSMMPLKVSGGGTVLRNYDRFQFTTTLDTFQGNSGSAVFDSETGLLEGILVSGKTDYIPSIENNPQSCKVVNTCDMQGNNCDGTDRGSLAVPGENVTRITTVHKFIK